MRENEQHDREFERRLKALFADIKPPQALNPEQVLPQLRARSARKLRVRKAVAFAAAFTIVIALSGFSYAALRGHADPDAAAPSAASYGPEALQREAVGDSEAGADGEIALEDRAPEAQNAACDPQAGAKQLAEQTTSGPLYDDCLAGCDGNHHLPECPHYGEDGR